MSIEILAKDIIGLCRIMSVSGFEYRATGDIEALYGEHFDELASDAVGNHILIKRCGRRNAPKILVDSHLDEVGMVVSGVLEGGFLRIASIGGIDRAILQGADVCVYGEQALRGVIMSMPPHLRDAKDGKLAAAEELLVDVGLGYSLEELESMAPIGTPIGFAPCYSSLGGLIAGKSFDDKACAAISARAIIDTPREELAGDIYLSLSAREESSRDGGVAVACHNIEPNYAMVIDVNFGNAPDAPERETVELEKGISVTCSASTHRGLSEEFCQLCKKENIDYMLCAVPSSTGTNATSVNLSRLGVPVVDVGLPLRNMHTYNEVISLKDCETLYRAVGVFIRSAELAEHYGREELLW